MKFVSTFIYIHQYDQQHKTIVRDRYDTKHIGNRTINDEIEPIVFQSDDLIITLDSISHYAFNIYTDCYNITEYHKQQIECWCAMQEF